MIKVLDTEHDPASLPGYKRLWANQYYSIGAYLNCNHTYSLTVSSKYWIDYPIKTHLNTWAYDNPYKLPKYLKARIEKMFLGRSVTALVLSLYGKDAKNG